MYEGSFITRSRTYVAICVYSVVCFKVSSWSLKNTSRNRYAFFEKELARKTEVTSQEELRQLDINGH